MPSLTLLKRVPYDLILVVGIKHWQCYLDHRYVPNTGSVIWITGTCQTLTYLINALHVIHINELRRHPLCAV